MRRIGVIIVCVWLSLSGWARSAFELTIDGGYATLLSYPGFTGGSRQGSYGLGAHIGYAYYPVRYFGVGIGVDARRYGGTLARPYTETLHGVYDSDGELYDLIHDYSSWNRHVQFWALEPNISLQFPVVFDSGFGLLLAVGASYQVGLSGSYVTDWRVTHTGYYDKWHMTITDVPEYGFLTEDGSSPAEAMHVPGQAAMFFRADALVPIATGWKVIAGVRVQYGFGHYQSFSVSLEVGVRTSFSAGKRRCMCEMEHFMSKK